MYTKIVLARLNLNSQVSYFAAGIVAHLASDRPELWTVAGTPKNVITSELWKVY